MANALVCLMFLVCVSSQVTETCADKLSILLENTQTKMVQCIDRTWLIPRIFNHPRKETVPLRNRHMLHVNSKLALVTWNC